MNSLEFAKKFSRTHKTILIHIKNILENYPDYNDCFVATSSIYSKRGRFSSGFIMNDRGYSLLISYRLKKTLQCKKCGLVFTTYDGNGIHNKKYCDNCAPQRENIGSDYYLKRKQKYVNKQKKINEIKNPIVKKRKLNDPKTIDYWNDNQFLGLRISEKTNLKKILRDNGFNDLNHMIDWFNVQSEEIGLNVKYESFERA